MFMDWNKINEIEKAGEVTPLDNSYEIEDAITLCKSLDDKIEFLEKLKKNRVSKIQEQIDKHEKSKQLFKDIITATLKRDGYKSLSFPGIGKVSVRETKGRWVINENEGRLIDELSKQLSVEEMGKIVKMEPKVMKKELYQALENLFATGKLPDYINKEEDRTSLTLSYDGDGIASKLEELETKQEEMTQKKNDGVEQYDDLNF